LRHSNTTIKKVQTLIDAPKGNMMQLGMKTFKQDEEVQTFSIKYCPSEATEDTWMFPGK